MAAIACTTSDPCAMAFISAAGSDAEIIGAGAVKAEIPEGNLSDLRIVNRAVITAGTASGAGRVAVGPAGWMGMIVTRFGVMSIRVSGARDEADEMLSFGTTMTSGSSTSEFQ